MEYRRFFVPDIGGGEIAVEGEEFHHARNVLRVREGEKVVLSAGGADEAVCTVLSVEKKRMTVRVDERRACPNEPGRRLVLVSGILKGDKTGFVAQKATELGAAEIVLFVSENGVARAGANAEERLNRVCREAAKQCGRSSAPRVTIAPDFASALDLGAREENKFFFCEFAGESEGDLADCRAGSTAVVVGSEGGFTRAEYDLARNKGYRGMTLGARILRADTAAVVALALAARFSGELGE